LIAAIAVTFYAYLAGGEVATIRSLTMIWVYLLSLWVGRDQEVLTTLSLAALLIVFFNPHAIFDLSFQLSFIAVLSIGLTITWWDRLFPLSLEGMSPLLVYLLKSLRLMAITTVGATLGTAPLTLYYFHQFGWVGLISNFVIIPLAGWVMIPSGLIAAVFSLLTDSGFPLVGWHQRIGDFYYRIVSLFAKIPFSEIHFASPPLFMVGLFYTVIFVALVRGISWRWIFPILAGFYLFFLGWGSLRIHPSDLRLAFLDVGQGDAAVVEFPKGEVMLVDGGHVSTGRMAIIPYLWERRIRKIDYLVMTHPDSDHIGGLIDIVDKFPVGEVWTNGMTRETSFFQDFQKALQERNIVSQVMTEDTPRLEISPCFLEFLNPSGKIETIGRRDYNNHSMVIRLSCPSSIEKTFSILFTGDIEKKAEKIKAIIVKCKIKLVVSDTLIARTVF